MPRSAPVKAAPEVIFPTAVIVPAPIPEVDCQLSIPFPSVVKTQLLFPSAAGRVYATS